MAIFRGSRGSTVASGEIVATTTEIVAALNQAIAAKNEAEAAQAAAELAETGAETAQSNAEAAETGAETAESNAIDAQNFAQEWANKDEDSLVSTAAGGNGVDDFSAFHWANKSQDSAVAASDSEDAAAISESNAQQAANDAESALDEFTDIYLGAKTSDPTLDNDGNPLQDGALYFNTTTNNLKIYSISLSEWIEVDFKSDSEIRGLFSGTGDIAYNSSTGEFSFDLDSNLSGGTGVDYSLGVISIGQPVATTDSVTFLDATFTGTGAVALPDGTEAQRPGVPTAGMIRFNSDTPGFEGYDGIEWGEIGGGGGATGGGTDQVFYQNDQVVTTDYTIPADQNAMTTGPIDINSGVTVTVETGARWVVI